MKPLSKRVYLKVSLEVAEFKTGINGWYCTVCNKIYHYQSDAQACCKEEKILPRNEHWLKDAIVQEESIGEMKLGLKARERPK